MKKLLFGLMAALLVLTATGVHSESHAADRVTKVVRTCKYLIGGVIADAVLVQSNGETYCNIYDIIVERVTLEHNVTTLTGTSVVFKVITTSDPSNNGATTDPALDGSDGATDLVSATLTATGRGSKGTSVPIVGGSGVGTNLGTKIGVWADVASISALEGFVYLTIFGRQ